MKYLHNNNVQLSKQFGDIIVLALIPISTCKTSKQDLINNVVLLSLDLIFR